MFVGALLALSMVAAACGGSDAEDATPASSDGVAAVAGARAGIVFVSDDGSAAAGSRTVFVATDVDSGEQTLVPVTGVGEEEETRVEVEVPPGTYRIETTGVAITDRASWTVSDISDDEVSRGVIIPFPQPQVAIKANSIRWFDDTTV